MHIKQVYTSLVMVHTDVLGFRKALAGSTEQV